MFLNLKFIVETSLPFLKRRRDVFTPRALEVLNFFEAQVSLLRCLWSNKAVEAAAFWPQRGLKYL